LNPVISNIGVVYTEAQIQNTYGQLKFSSCGNKLAAAAGYLDTLDIFDFDILTGEVSNRIALPMPGHIYGVEFSPSEQFVYVTTYYYGYGIIQYDLNAGSVADVIASQTVINSTPDLYALQLGLDGKIYVCKAWGTYLDAVDKPNLPQYDCDYISNAVSLDPNYEGTSAALGLPNFVSSFLGLSACIATNTDEELNIESAGLFPNPSTDQFTLRNLRQRLRRLQGHLRPATVGASGRALPTRSRAFPQNTHAPNQQSLGLHRPATRQRRLLLHRARRPGR